MQLLLNDELLFLCICSGRVNACKNGMYEEGRQYDCIHD